jgi:hypothetical protein
MTRIAGHRSVRRAFRQSADAKLTVPPRHNGLSMHVENGQRTIFRPITVGLFAFYSAASWIRNLAEILVCVCATKFPKMTHIGGPTSCQFFGM